MKTLANFSKLSLSESEMKQITGGLRCRRENFLTGRYEFYNYTGPGDRCPDLP